MSIFLFIIGTMLQITAYAQPSDEQSLYQKILSSAREHALQRSQDELQNFVATILQDSWNTAPSDITLALSSDLEALCENKCATGNHRCNSEDDEPIDRQECQQLAGEIYKLASIETQHIALARSLQVIALSIEASVMGEGNPQQNLQRKLQSLINIWSTGESNIEAALLDDEATDREIDLDAAIPDLFTEDGPNLAGAYPPEPPLEGTLCDDISAKEGFLCRPIEQEEDICSNDDIDPLYELVHCRETEEMITASGPNMCADIPWRGEVPIDPQTQCAVEITCAQTCPGGSANVNPKRADGTIEICVSGSLESPAGYLIAHELVHAKQLCNKPPGYWFYTDPELDVRQACCKAEGEAYAFTCQRMAADGAFTLPDGSPRLSADGIPMTVQTCTESLTDFACSSRDNFGHCPVSRPYTEAFLEDLFESIDELKDEDPGNMGVTCQEATNPETMNPRIATLIQSIETQSSICTPGSEIEYRNTIGNNLCYTGMCLEETFETHDLTGNRMSAVMGDEKSPWGALPIDSENKSLLEPIVTSAQSMLSIPHYELREFLQQFDMIFCQTTGSPPLTPPSRCALGGERSFTFLNQERAELSTFIAQEAQGTQSATSPARGIGTAVGMQIGANLFSAYIDASLVSLTELFSYAATLLNQTSKTSFPTEMCPLYP